MIISEARRAANRANARRSTGPKTAAGKQAVRLNALKHGLTGRTAVLDDEDAGAFDALLADLEARLRPEGGLECEQVRAMAEALWRMRRGPSLEAVTLQTLIEQEEAGELSAEEVIATPLLLLRIGRYEGQIQRSYERARDRLRQLQAERPASARTPSPAPAGEGRGPSRSDGKGEGQGTARRVTPGSTLPPDSHPDPLPQGGRGSHPGKNIPQFSAENGFVSSFCHGPAEWPLKARLRASCALDALLGPPPPASWRFASALQGATVAPAREALPRAA